MYCFQFFESNQATHCSPATRAPENNHGHGGDYELEALVPGDYPGAEFGGSGECVFACTEGAKGSGVRVQRATESTIVDERVGFSPVGGAARAAWVEGGR